MSLERALQDKVRLSDSDGIVIVLVPGYAYRENGRLTRAGLQDQGAILGKLGLRVEFVAVDPNGTALECASVVE